MAAALKKGSPNVLADEPLLMLWQLSVLLNRDC